MSLKRGRHVAISVVRANPAAGSGVPFFVALFATAVLLVAPLQGFLAIIVDTDTSGLLEFQSGVFTGTPPALPDIQTAKVTSSSECASASFSDNGLPGASFAVDLNNDTGVYEYGYVCIVNSGGQAGQLLLAEAIPEDLTSVSQDVTCEPGEPAAGDTSDCEPFSELRGVLLYEPYDSDCDNALVGTKSTSFIGVDVLDNSFEPGEVCFLALRWIDDAAATDTELARAQTDFSAHALEFRIDDGT